MIDLQPTNETVGWYQQVIRQFKDDDKWDKVVDRYKQAWVQLDMDTVKKDLQEAAKHNVPKASEFLKELAQKGIKE